MTEGSGGAKKAAPNGSVVSNTPEYIGDPLPSGCPPHDGAPMPNQIVLRLVPQDPAFDQDFLPSSLLPNRQRPAHACDECRWCACSVYLDTKANRQRLRDMTKLKNLSNMKFIAHVKVSPDAGIAKPWDSDPEHVSFWAVKTFSFAAATETCEAV